MTVGWTGTARRLARPFARPFARRGSTDPTRSPHARPRFLFTAFPLFISVAAWWPEPDDDPDHHRASWDRAGWDLTLVIGGAGLVALTAVYGVFGAIP